GSYLIINRCVSLRLFFCPSRRRHTRAKRDWSSDVCSSDLSTLMQSAAGISVDGVVGPQTWKALNGSTTIGDGGGSDGSFNGQARSEERRVGKAGRMRDAPPT